MTIKFISSIVDNIDVHYFEDFIDKKTADSFFNLMEKERGKLYNSDEESMVYIFGKYFKIPRKQVAYGEKGLTYKFSGTTVLAKDWNQNDEICSFLRLFKNKIKKLTGEDYNFVLINRYKDGYDSIGPHSDDEKDLGDKPSIIGINFGAERRIIFESKKQTSILPNSVELNLKHGSLYIMNHPTNKYWKHSIPKDINIKTPRINLTFRKMQKN